MTHDNDWSGAATARREFFEQEAAMYGDGARTIHIFRAPPVRRKPWWRRLMDWWRGRR
jgi:hypothetical protein